MAEALIEITRVFEAQRERVWSEWTQAESFADWFGGPEAEVPLSSVSWDLRPGGLWSATMFAGPGRHEIRWEGEFREVEPPERLVFTVTDTPAEDAHAVCTVELTDLGDGRTEMRFEQRGGPPPEMVDATKRGWGVFLDRMAERLAESD